MKYSVFFLVGLFSFSAFAHHNYNLKFDNRQEITLTGTVTKFDWKNPHIEIIMDVQDENGELTRWILPTAAPRIADRNGISEDTVLPGDVIVAVGWPARDGSYEMRARTMTLSDGTEFLLSPNRNGSGMGGGMR
jgi:hypothetical protein